MRVVVCGDRTWDNRDVVLRRLSDLPPNSTLIHGGSKGADKLCADVASELGHEVIAVLPNWELYARGAGKWRNTEMLLMRPRIVIAFHDFIHRSKTTANCIMQARYRGIKVELIHSEAARGWSQEELL